MPLIKLVLDRTHRNQSQAAKILGINRNTLKKKIDEYRIGK
jgi:DNA-binding protein Fis